MKTIIKEIMQIQAERLEKPNLPREFGIDHSLQKVQTIVGPRRSGKSSLLKLELSSLLEKGIPWSHICYFPLEDERLRFTAFEPDDILQAHAELYPQNPLLKDVYFIFDEIQFLPKWEHFINRIYEQISKHVIITGSNSKALHTNVAAILRGRGVAFELLNLSFIEFLHWKNISTNLTGSNAIKIKHAFNQYLKWGGYPEVILNKEDHSLKILQEYFNTVIYRDIIDATNPTNYQYVRYLLHRIADNTGKNTNLLKIFNELKSRGYKVSQASLYEMADLAEAIYLFKRISKFDFSLIKRENSEKKCYFVDNGMLHALGSNFSDNNGRFLENIFFWHLYRKYGSIYTETIFYYKDTSYECDFILQHQSGSYIPIQVCWDLSDMETKERELKGLIKACKMTNQNKGFIFTYDTEERIHLKDVEIIILPVWKWISQMDDLKDMME